MMACSNDIGVTNSTDVGKITLSLDASGATFGTRADATDNDAERKLEWIDVFVFTAGAENDSASDDTFLYHERIDHSAAAEPHTLGLDLTALAENQAYYVDVVANSKTLQSINNIAADITSRGALFSKIETTEYIQMTGASGVNNVPTSFLMDGVAYTQSTEPATPSSVVLRPTGANMSENVNLKVTLRRAAAKVVFNFKLMSGDDSYFKSFGTLEDPSSSNYTPAGSYFIDNMKYKAMLTAEAEEAKLAYGSGWTEADNYLRTTTEIPYGIRLIAGAPSNGLYKTMTLTTYVYCHKWDYQQNSQTSLSEIEPSVIVNLPAVDKDGNNHSRNYYEISLDAAPMVDGGVNHFALERNHYYVINATINALGGSNPQVRVELDDVKYQTYPWDETTINVGGDNGARYLTLNTNHIEMHNEDMDDYSLTFASSSPLTSITLKEAYYYNKYNTRIDLSSGDTIDKAVKNQISATAATAGSLTGGIVITSPMQITQSGSNVDAHKNTIRYLTFEVENEQGLTKTFTVMQYPLIYITNQQGWYSYRSDFIANGQSAPTTYENYSSSNNIVSITYNKGTYGYTTTGSQSNGGYGGTSNFWYSKVANSQNSNGMSPIQSYYYRNGKQTTTYETANAQMYHIRVTATSDKYTLGIPRVVNDNTAQNNGFTDPGEDNSRLVSPSFMIASRLGVIQMQNIKYTNSSDDRITTEMNDIFGKHCREYVETYRRVSSNGTEEVIHLDDWRLPTAAELNIIIDLQGNGRSNNTNYYAIDYLLNACYYYSASGPQYNPNNEHGGSYGGGGARGDDGNYASYTAIRCVRDAFDSKTPPVITNTASSQVE